MNRLLLYSPDGTGRVLPQPEEQLPALVTLSGEHVLLKLVGRDAVSIDRRLEDSQAHSILQRVNTPLGQLAAVYEWEGLGQSVLAVGLVRDKKLPDGFQAGLFRFSSDEGEKAADLLMRVSAWDFYVLGYQLVTSTLKGGGTGYFLDMDDGAARLFEVPPGGAARELKGAVPSEISKLPKIDATMYGPKDAPPLFAKLAQERMPTGIYGGPDGNIYLLGREPTPKDGNAWWLFRISPRGKLLGKALLPTRAQHVSIVVSPDTFFLIERGDVYPQGSQQINTMVTVPASILERAPLQGIEICPRRK